RPGAGAGVAARLGDVVATRAQAARERGANQAGAKHHHAHGGRLPARALRPGSLASVLSTRAVSVFSRARAGAAATGPRRGQPVVDPVSTSPPRAAPIHPPRAGRRRPCHLLLSFAGSLPDPR